ncbi:hypothetical protein FPV67DRAFT_1782322 [Lyophyllum atratum]|nr:hypothetical protein FPV67DRAFT_1782322 [Lyophyllum atratum]
MDSFATLSLSSFDDDVVTSRLWTPTVPAMTMAPSALSHEDVNPPTYSLHTRRFTSYSSLIYWPGATFIVHDPQIHRLYCATATFIPLRLPYFLANIRYPTNTTPFNNL